MDTVLEGTAAAQRHMSRKMVSLVALTHQESREYAGRILVVSVHPT
jgi:hypothetical protein